MNSILRPRSELCALAQVHHGASDYAELEHLGLDPDDLLDFSVNSNPFGPSPAVIEAVSHVRLDRYPDRECLALRQALSKHLRVDADQIVAGNGTAELIWLIALAYLNPARRALIIGPTFGEYERAIALMGGHIHYWNATPERCFSVDMDEICRAVELHQPHVVFVCNPNNPTGQLIPADGIAACAACFKGTMFVVDEAYRAFVPATKPGVVLRAPNILSLRSMTKDYALAGLRLGYAVGSHEVVRALASVCPPWSVNAVAQAAGLAALEDDAHLRRTLNALNQAKGLFVAGLAHIGLDVFPSATHFFLVRVGDGACFRRTLMQCGIQVRDCASFGLPAFVRIATRRPEENERLINAIRVKP